MRHEIDFLGLFFPSLLLCALVAGGLWFGVDWLFLRLRLWHGFWHPPLARLSLYFVLFSAVALIWPDF